MRLAIVDWDDIYYSQWGRVMRLSQAMPEITDKSKCSIVYYNDDTLNKARRQQVWPWFVIVERKVIKME